MKIRVPAMSLPPEKAKDRGFLEALVQKASNCRLEARNCTGDRKWVLLAMAEELEELGHELSAREIHSQMTFNPRKRGQEARK